MAAQTNGGKDLCIMYHRSDYWEPFVPELDTKDCLRSSGTKEILHVELWHNRMFYYFFIFFLFISYRYMRCERSAYWSFDSWDGSGF